MAANPLAGLEGSAVKHIKHQKEMVDYIGRVLVELMQNNLQTGDHIFTGTIHNSTGYDPETTTVKSLSPYSKVLEYGRRPGSHVPIDKLQKWVMVKQGLTEEEALVEAKRLEAHIFKHGTMPTKFAKISLIQLTNGHTPSRVKAPTHKRLSGSEAFHKKAKQLRQKTQRGMKKFRRLK